MQLRKLLFALVALSVTPPFLFGQSSGNITSSQAVCIDVQNDKSTVGIQVGGTWTGTLQPQVSIQGQALTNAQVIPSTSTTPQSTITGNGVFYANVGGGGVFCIVGNTVSSGTANVFLNVSKGVNASTLGGGGGSGSGTVSANNTAAGAVANYTAAAGSTTVGPTTLNYAAPTLTVSTAGGGNGSLALSGNTSGTATVTAPAVAGTSTNPFAFSNVQQGPSGAKGTPTYGFTTANQGMFFDSGNVGLGFSCGSASNVCAELSGTGGFISLYLGSAFAFGVSSSADAGGAGPDTKLSRVAAGVWSVDSSTTGNTAGLLRSANTCAITTDVSLTVNTPNSFCSFSLPAVAKAWAFRCDIQWAITAGSGTNTFALGVNPSQTPTGTTNAEAQIYTATTGTQTMGSTAISASGADLILTGATYTPAATVQLAKISGTLLASGTAGTFAIQATANGTTATAAVKAGSACWLN